MEQERYAASQWRMRSESGQADLMVVVLSPLGEEKIPFTRGAGSIPWHLIVQGTAIPLMGA